MMKLENLLSSLDHPKVVGSTDIKVSSIISDSREAKETGLFVAVRGNNFNGHDFINEAIKKGVVVIVGEDEPSRFNIPKSVVYVKVKDSRKALSLLSSKWFDNPSAKLKVIGVTGTDGKTTTANIIYQFLKTAGKKVGLISTIGAEINGAIYETGLHVTNPDQFSLQKLLAKMVDFGLEYAVLEITSHGIDQKRIEGINFGTTVLTNITPEHLDYHRNFENYQNTKISFLLQGKYMVLNKDDSSFEILQRQKKDKYIYSYSLEKDADYRALNISDRSEGLSFEVLAKNGKETFLTKMLGNYNIANCLAAIAVVRHYNVSWKDIGKCLSLFELPFGRMQKINFGQNFDIYVDFAHTPNALEHTLQVLKNKTSNKLIVVFGCAGERDKVKRKKMSEISCKIADYSIFTAEDPRSESIFDIFSLMHKGAIKAGAKQINFGIDKKSKRDDSDSPLFAFVPERHEAAAFAILKLAKRGDCVVFCGKGHEKSLAYGNFEHPWSDQKIIENLVKARKDLATIILAAGRGKRMKSQTPKVLHKIAGRPMISYTLENLRKSGLSNLILVVGFKKDEVIRETQGAVNFAYQSKVLGTGDATAKGLTQVDSMIKTVVVLNGDDSAFYSPETIKKVIASHLSAKAVISFVSLIRDNPEGLGRLVRDKKGKLLGIVEEKDATLEERKIKEVNDGLYVFERQWLKNNLAQIKISAQGEYYLVDLIEMALRQEKIVNVFQLKNSDEWQGINTLEQLAEAEEKMEKKLKKWN